MRLNRHIRIDPRQGVAILLNIGWGHINIRIPLKNPIGGASTLFGAKVFNRSRPTIPNS